MLLQQLPDPLPLQSLHPHCFIAIESSQQLTLALQIASLLRQNRYRTEIDLEAKGIKKGLEIAIKKNASFALMLGSQEISLDQVTIKDLAQRTQESIPLKELLPYLNQRGGTIE